MSESKHTPAPWFFDVADYGDDAYIYADKGPCIAQVVHHDTGAGLSDNEGCDLTKEQAIANANLLATAPELLEVLSKIVKNAELTKQKGFLIGEAEQVITKAKGES